MAFETVTFQTDTAADALTSVKDFLDDAVGTWFDSITSADTTITFTKSETDVLLLRFASSEGENNAVEKWTLVDSAATPNSLGYHQNHYWSAYKWTKGYKSSNGVFLRNASANSSLFITKSTDDTIILCGKGSNQQWYNNFNGNAYRNYIFWGWMCADVEKDVNICAKGSTYSGGNTSNYPITNFYQYAYTSAGKTSMCPVVTPCGSYSENLFMVPFSQYASSNGTVFEAGGDKYVTDGLFALKE